MARKYVVHLTETEQATLQFLNQLLVAGKAAARTLVPAYILLKADASEGRPGWTDSQIVDAFEVSLSTVGRIRHQFVEAGLLHALAGLPDGAAVEPDTMVPVDPEH